MFQINNIAYYKSLKQTTEITTLLNHHKAIGAVIWHFLLLNM